MKSVEKISNRNRKLIEYMKNLSYQSGHSTQKHAAILYAGGSIINSGFNSADYNQFASRFRPINKEHSSLHAEISCMLNIERSVLNKSDLWVIRVNNNGEIRNSKPCMMCRAAIVRCGIKRVFYSDEDGMISVVKPFDFDNVIKRYHL